MVNKSVDLANIKEALTDWAKGLKQNELCATAHVFGSLTNKNGKYFIISGAEKSDIDILLTFPKSATDALSRVNIIDSIQSSLGDIETKIAVEYPQSEGHADECRISILLVPDYDIYHSIHKGFDPKIYNSRLFIDLLSDDQTEPVSVCKYIDEKYHMEHIEAFAVARMAQKIRNNYLQTNFFGSQLAEHQDDPYDTLPKELLRIGALLHYVHAASDISSRDEEKRINLSEGQDFILKCFEKRADNCTLCSGLLEKLKDRQFNRAQSPKLLPVDILFTIEILYDEMRKKITPSIRETLDKLVAEGVLPKG